MGNVYAHFEVFLNFLYFPRFQALSRLATCSLSTYDDEDLFNILIVLNINFNSEKRFRVTTNC